MLTPLKATKMYVSGTMPKHTNVQHAINVWQVESAPSRHEGVEIYVETV